VGRVLGGGLLALGVAGMFTPSQSPDRGVVWASLSTTRRPHPKGGGAPRRPPDPAADEPGRPITLDSGGSAGGNCGHP
jgi:hypothetical protein